MKNCAFCYESVIGCEVVEIDGKLVHYSEECIMGHIEEIGTFKIPTEEELKEAEEERKVAAFMEERN